MFVVIARNQSLYCYRHDSFYLTLFYTDLTNSNRESEPLILIMKRKRIINIIENEISNRRGSWIFSVTVLIDYRRNLTDKQWFTVFSIAEIDHSSVTFNSSLILRIFTEKTHQQRRRMRAVERVFKQIIQTILLMFTCVSKASIEKLHSRWISFISLLKFVLTSRNISFRVSLLNTGQILFTRFSLQFRSKFKNHRQKDPKEKHPAYSKTFHRPFHRFSLTKHFEGSKHNLGGLLRLEFTSRTIYSTDDTSYNFSTIRESFR